MYTLHAWALSITNKQQHGEKNVLKTSAEWKQLELSDRQETDED